MKIVLIGTAYPLRGGIAHYVGLLWKHLSRDHDVTVVTFSRQYPEFLFPGTSQEEQGDAGIPLESRRWIDSINPLNWIAAGFKVRKLRADLIVFKFWMPFFAPCYGIIAAIARWRRKTKVVFIDDNVIPHEARPGDKLLTRFAFRFVDGHVVQSESVRRDLLLWKPGARWTLLPHPVYEIFGGEMGRAEARERLTRMMPELALAPGEKILLFFGYVREYKGLHLLLEAMPEIRRRVKARLLVVGEFYQDEEAYRDHARRLGLGAEVVIRASYVPNEQVGLFFSAADILTLPYLSATQSGIIQIAYNFHRPVIATDVGGLAEVVRTGKTGYIVPPRDAPALAEAVARFFEEEQFDAFRANVIEEKKKYSWDHMTRGIEEFHHSLAAP